MTKKVLKNWKNDNFQSSLNQSNRIQIEFGIMQNEALGRPITEGKVPEVKRRRSRKGILNF